MARHAVCQRNPISASAPPCTSLQSEGAHLCQLNCAPPQDARAIKAKLKNFGKSQTNCMLLLTAFHLAKALKRKLFCAMVLYDSSQSFGFSVIQALFPFLRSACWQAPLPPPIETSF